MEHGGLNTGHRKLADFTKPLLAAEEEEFPEPELWNKGSDVFRMVSDKLEAKTANVASLFRKFDEDKDGTVRAATTNTCPAFPFTEALLPLLANPTHPLRRSGHPLTEDTHAPHFLLLYFCCLPACLQVDYKELRTGLRNINCQLTDTEFQCLVDLVDADKSGDIDYQVCCCDSGVRHCLSAVLPLEFWLRPCLSVRSVCLSGIAGVRQRRYYGLAALRRPAGAGQLGLQDHERPPQGAAAPGAQQGRTSTDAGQDFSTLGHSLTFPSSQPSIPSQTYRSIHPSTLKRFPVC
eukprot:SAG22_NODE_642_length_8224_cov_21.479508_4_plen_292_part_00